MKYSARAFPAWSHWFIALLLWANPLPGQSSRSVNITPSKATLLVGESQTFRLVDQSGRMQRGVSWTSSDSDALQLQDGDELLVTAKRAGDFTIQARSDNGSSGATITVMDGAALPQGTVKWSGAAIDGCKTTKVIPAVPSANGPDIYEQSQCQDGEYLAAYTSEGIQLWRRKIGDTGAPSVPEAGKNDVPAIRPNSSRLDLHSPSICDLADVGAGQEKIRELLNQHNLSFNQGAANERAWTIDESTVQCKLWFDEKLVLAKKRKILVTE